ncbi:EF-hand domain-containing protein [Simplicispira psychrophila]|uniref:EF-hand domain-containing protein n=1 Tax=Simplicispira psychrophila TaxID=80882 RepID=UPI0012EB73BB|nr:EF-hand domain-containing protein [Simplicispira psychrophila]
MRFLRMLCALLLIGVCALASAQSSTAATTAPRGPDGAPLSKGEIKAMRDFQLLDFNGDGKISRSEVALFPRLAAAFSEADTNHDNYLNYEEVRAYAVRYRAKRDRQRQRERASEVQAPDGTDTEAGQDAEEKP